jgi:hypothetical protein
MTPTFPERIHLVLLGGGHVVDTTPVHPGILAARLQTLSASLRPAVLGHGLSTGDVHGVHIPALEGY